METLVWLRVPGDIVFAAGSVFLAVYCAVPAASSGEPARAGRRPARMKLTAFTDYSLRVLDLPGRAPERRATDRRDLRRVRHQARTT
jgi:hypothetical protein